MLKAIWGLQYDYHADKCYQAPVCAVCDIDDVPVIRKHKRGRTAECLNCGRKQRLTKDMRTWLKLREETKEEYSDCLWCKGKDTLKTVYRRNVVTLKWQAAFGQCEKCGNRFIV